MSATTELQADWFSKPGDSLRGAMERRGTTADHLAQHLEGGLATLRGLFDGSVAIDVRRAECLAKLVGGSSDFWLRRQAQYEQRLERAVTAAEREADDWICRVPVPTTGTSRRPRRATPRDEIRDRMTFFNVPTMRTWHDRYGRFCADTRFRTTNAFRSDDAALLLWLRRGELETDLVSTSDWNPDVLRARLDAIRGLSRISQPARFLPKLRELCAEAGVAVVIVKAPQGCRASGASRLVSSKKAMLLLSFRYRADDQFWFTVFHEIGHLLLHGAATFVEDEDTPADHAEREANDFAASCIVPSEFAKAFEELLPNRDAIIRFGVKVGVAPGLVLGQMQHQDRVHPTRLNSLKRTWTWSEIEPALV